VEERRIIDLETRLAYQEHTLAELNDALTSQQAQISRLEAQLAVLAKQVRMLSESAPAAGTGVELPPHY